MLLTLTMKIKLTKSNINYYLDKGYEGQIKDIIEINTVDLPEHSDRKIAYQCDYPGCQEIIILSYSDYIKKRKRIYASEGDFCNKHSKIVRTEWMQNNAPLEYQQEKDKRVINMQKTCLNKYGVTNPMQDKQIYENWCSAFVAKYGVTNPMYNSNFREHLTKSIMSSNNNGVNGIPCSANQKHINELYHGELNVCISGFFVDILLNNNIYFEYNGQGHRLSVIMHRMTSAEFDLKEIQRYNILKQKGYKQIVFVSEHHKKLPSDEVLLSIKEAGEQYLLASVDHNWIEFNFDSNTIRTKRGILDYDFIQPIIIDNII